MDSINQLTAPICTICRGQPVNAVSLDCNHIFCYLCVKSAAETTGCCPLCRKEIGIEFNFQKHKIIGSTRVPSSRSGYYWFYEGYQGWWLYDAETNSQLEEAFEKRETSVSKFIAGGFYTIDVQNMTQRIDTGDGRTRKIMRSKIEDVDKVLGLSGLRSEDFEDYLEMIKTASSDLME